mmetsp:Transcript_23302/g.66285  ORF Transcript_23302/g.66285 Transcript_23302/m.66285 type:complete len:886 (-) Transcript_23302:64-2721(-)
MGMKSGSLLRLFQSEYFDAHLHMTYLLRMEQSGVQDYLVNELYKMKEDDVDFYLPQLCQVALLRYQTSSLHRFLLDKASRSMHFALRIHWLMQSFVEDRLPEISESALAMVNACETVVVNSASEAVACPSRRSSGCLLEVGGQEEPNSPSSSSLRRSPSCPELHTPHSATAAATGAGISFDGAGEGGAADEETLACGSRRSGTPPAVQRRSPGCPDAELRRQCTPPGGGGASSSSATTSHAAALRHLAEVSQVHTPEQKAAVFRLQPHLPNAYSELGEPVTGWVASVVNEGTLRGEMRHFILKQRRCDYFNTQNHFISMITKLSTALVTTAEKEERKACLASTMHLLNRWLLERRTFMTMNNEGSFSLLGLHIPILRSRDTRQQLLRVHIEQCRVFSSATRAPFLLVYETANLDEEPVEFTAGAVSSENGVHGSCVKPSEDGPEGKRKKPKPLDVLESDAEILPASLTEPLCAGVLSELNDIADPGGDAAAPAGSDEPEPHRKALRRRLAAVAPEEWLRIPAAVPPIPEATPSKPSRCLRCPHAAAWRDMEDLPAPPADDTADNGSAGAEAEATMSGVPPECARCPKIKRVEVASKTRLRIWGESWSSRKERLRRASPFGRYPSWALNGVVVKGGDDLRQELLASQVIKQFSAIFKEAGLPLWLYEAEVLVANSSSGFMECFHDTMSVNGIKKHFPGQSLAEIFQVAFADRLFQAKQNFIESYAAYSLVVWFLQVKDRHNDNLLMMSTGHVVHLDFGFMLSNSPGGNIGFESSPFKLTQEFLDVMDGECSDQYEYFRTLVIRGFLEARKHVDRIILPVRMLLTGSKLPCFREGPEAVLQSLHDRFFVNLTEAACIEKIAELIDTSVNNWRTIQYDNYQRIFNGIL